MYFLFDTAHLKTIAIDLTGEMFGVLIFAQRRPNDHLKGDTLLFPQLATDCHRLETSHPIDASKGTIY